MKRVMYMYVMMLCTTACAMQPPSGSQITDESVLTFVLEINRYPSAKKLSYIAEIIKERETLGLKKDTITALESIYDAYSWYLPLLRPDDVNRFPHSVSHSGTPITHILFFGYLHHCIKSTEPLAIALKCGANINCLDQEGMSLLAREMLYKNRTEERTTSRLTFLLKHGARIDATRPNALAHALFNSKQNERLLLIHAIDQITKDTLQEAVNYAYRAPQSISYYLHMHLNIDSNEMPEDIKKRLRRFEQ